MANTRVRGFAPWSPRAATQMVLQQVLEVLAYYRAQDLLPLTNRQVFYRLVSVYDFPKTDADSERLNEYLNRGRRAGIIPWDAFRDDGAVVVGADRYGGPEQFLAGVQTWARGLELDLLQFQPVHIEVQCEAAGMVPMLQRVAEPYGVTVRSSGGFDSTTTKHGLASFYAGLGKPVRLLHVGDLDQSGEHMHLALDEDISSFLEVLGGQCEVQRVAVTAEQQERFNLPTQPPKLSDKRSYGLPYTVQAEALDPADLARLVRGAIEAELDMDRHHQALAWQEQSRARLITAVADLRLNG